MDFAINKSTREMISALEIFKNGSYQNLDKGEWIAPNDSIGNLEELEEKNIKDVPVHYTKEKEYTNYNNTPIVCAPHFAFYPNSPAKSVEESPMHKKLKEWLFNRLKNDDLEIRYSKGTKPHKYDNKLKLSELDIDWNNYSIEVTTKSTKRLRADILLPFKSKHLFLGNGIIFEIQLSYQTKNRTNERTIERALHGYSVCWLFEKDFETAKEIIYLKENIILVNSFSEQMHFAKKSFVGKLKNVVELQCRFLDEKIKETNQGIELLEEKKEGAYNELIKRLNTREALLINKISALENNPFKGMIEAYKNQINIKFQDKNEEFEEGFNSKMKELNYPFCIGVCVKCNSGYMAKKITKNGKGVYGCSNYPECKHSIWIN